VNDPRRRTGRPGDAPVRRLLERSLIAGAAGTVAITVSTHLEMRLSGREPSAAPIDALERIAGRRLPARGALAEAGVSLVHHVAYAVAASTALALAA